MAWNLAHVCIHAYLSSVYLYMYFYICVYTYLCKRMHVRICTHIGMYVNTYPPLISFSVYNSELSRGPQTAICNMHANPATAFRMPLAESQHRNCGLTNLHSDHRPQLRQLTECVYSGHTATAATPQLRPHREQLIKYPRRNCGLINLGQVLA